MIGRVWRGWTTTADANAYEEHLRRATLPALDKIAGHRGAYVLRREAAEGVEFIVLTLWNSLESLRAFAGEDYEVAVIPPEARALLTRFEETAAHYGVAVDTV